MKETWMKHWLEEKRENQQEKAQTTILCEKFGLIILKKRWGTVTPVPNISKVQQLCFLLDALFVPSNFWADSPLEQFENFFVFTIIWTFGSALLVDGKGDFRQHFSNLFNKQFDQIAERIGKKTTVYDVWVDPSTCQFVEDSRMWAWHLSSSEYLLSSQFCHCQLGLLSWHHDQL